MKITYSTWLYRILCIALLAFSSSLYASPSTPESVVLAYYDALKQGDTVMIKNILDGKLLQSKQRVLSNPNYPQILRNWYLGSTIQIIDTQVQTDGSSLVNSKISWDKSRQINIAFHLSLDATGSYRIDNEITQND